MKPNNKTPRANIKIRNAENIVTEFISAAKKLQIFY